MEKNKLIQQMNDVLENTNNAAVALIVGQAIEFVNKEEKQ